MSDLIPISGSQFGGGERPGGLGVQLYKQSDGRAVGTVTLDKNHQGLPGYAHGGISAVILDEAIGMAVWMAGYRVVVVNLNLSYRLPVPLEEEFQVWGQIEKIDGRKITGVGAIVLQDGRVAVEATGLFIEAPQIFKDQNFKLKIGDNSD